VAGSSERDTEFSDSIKRGEFLGYLSDCQLLLDRIRYFPPLAMHPAYLIFLNKKHLSIFREKAYRL